MTVSIIDTLKNYDELYYEMGKSPISDEYYDHLKDLARKDFPYDSYFQEVGASVSRDKVELPYVLGSLKKTNTDTVDKWVSGHTGSYLISQKMDGVSILVIYENGYVKKAYTRGNGLYGRDITNKALAFCPKIDNDSIMILRGEAVLIGDVYSKLGFSTARNGVAGILNRDDISLCKHITPYFYELIQFDSLTTYTEYERFVLIESLGLRTPKWKLLETFELESVLSMIAKDIYDTDGVVICLNESERENVKYPENKVAFKIQGESVEAHVESVEWNVTRSGRVVPVVVVETVELGGVNVQRATGFNAKFISDNAISEGTVIELRRANDVIPYIIRVVSTLKNASLPIVCPSCGMELDVRGVDLICTNRFGCESRVLKTIEHFLRTLGAENITAKTLEKVQIYSIQDAYEITDVDILQYEGFGVRSASLIIQEIRSTLNTTSDKLLEAFGIPGVGKEISRSLLKCFGSVESVLDANEDELRECEGVGPKIAENIIKESNMCYEIYKYLLNKGLTLESEKGEKMSLLSGKQFALTGKGPMGREELTSLIEAQGGTVKGMSKSTNYLVTSDMNSTSGKTKKAKDYGVEIITYEQLMEMID